MKYWVIVALSLNQFLKFAADRMNPGDKILFMSRYYNSDVVGVEATNYGFAVWALK